MADTVYIGNEVLVVLDTPEAFIDKLLEERVSYDAALYFRQYVKNVKGDIEWQKCEADEQEQVADGYLQYLRDARDELEALHDFVVNSTRLNREQLQSKIAKIIQEIDSNL